MTIFNPDSSLLRSNVRMTNQVSFHNITLTPSQTINIGIYSASMTCLDGTLNGDDTFFYQITPSGDTNILGLMIILIVIFYFITFVSAYFENEWLTLLGGMSLMILGLYTLNNGLDIFRNFATHAFAFFTLGLGFYFSITAGLKIINDNLN